MSSSGLPALAVNPVQFGAEANNAVAQSQLAQVNLQKQTELAPLEVEAEKQKNQLQGMANNNATLAQVAQQAQAVDPDEAPAVWDAGMKAAAAKGNPVAGQYVGHYRPDLAEHVSTVYGGDEKSGSTNGSGANGKGTPMPGPDPQMLDMQISQMPPAAVSQSLGKANSIISSFNNVKDQQSWQSELQVLQDNGIDVSHILPSKDWNPLNYAAASRAVNNLVPYRDAMERAVARQQAGLGVPIPRNIVKTDAGIWEVNPYAPPGTPATLLASTPSYQRTNATDALGRPILQDEHTGHTIVGTPSDPNAPTSASLSSWAANMTRAENSTGNPAATNPRSTATGNGQFINQTWLDTVKANRPDLAQGRNDAQILALRSDPSLSAEMTAANAQTNGAKLVASGQPVNGTTLALAHRFGPDGAATILDAKPSTPIENLVSPAVLKANPDLKGQTAGGYAQNLVKQFGVQPVDIGMPVPTNAPTTLSPEERELETKVLPEQFEKARESYESAQNLKLQLANMQDQLAQLPTSGFLAPGTGDNARLAYAKKLNSLATVFGVQDKNLPFTASTVASGEDIVKGTTRLGFDLARQLGSREAMMIVQQAVGAVPGIENTPRGAKLIFGALNTAAQRQSDYYEYLNSWAQTHPNTLGADVAFNKAYPVQHYANQALLAGVPQNRVQYLKANPKAAKDFDAYYGKGLSSVVLGDK